MKKFVALLLAAIMMMTVCSMAMAETSGLGISSSIGSSKDAADGNDGAAQVDSAICAVVLDDNGVITAIHFDNAQTKVAFSAEGAITADKTAEVKTKRELGADYGMVVASGIGKEIDAQMDALEAWCIGKTVEEVLGMKTYDKGDGHHTTVPDEEDLKTGCTIDVGAYLAALAKAAANAK